MMSRSRPYRSIFNGSRRGQFFSYDAMVAGLMFAILLTILYVYWSSLRATVFTQIDDLFRTSMDVSNVLLTTGNPTDWNMTDVSQIGLVSSMNSLDLDENKVESLRVLAGQDYESVRAKIGASPYQFYITIDASPPVEVGLPFTVESTGKVSIVRPVVYQGRASNLTVTIWSNFTVS